MNNITYFHEEDLQFFRMLLYSCKVPGYEFVGWQGWVEFDDVQQFDHLPSILQVFEMVQHRLQQILLSADLEKS